MEKWSRSLRLHISQCRLSARRSNTRNSKEKAALSNLNILMLTETFTANWCLPSPTQKRFCTEFKLVLVGREKYRSFLPFPLYFSSIRASFPAPSPLCSKNRTEHLEEKWVGVHQGGKQDKRQWDISVRLAWVTRFLHQVLIMPEQSNVGLLIHQDLLPQWTWGSLQIVGWQRSAGMKLRNSQAQRGSGPGAVLQRRSGMGQAEREARWKKQCTTTA